MGLDTRYTEKTDAKGECSVISVCSFLFYHSPLPKVLFMLNKLCSPSQPSLTQKVRRVIVTVTIMEEITFHLSFLSRRHNF